MTTATSNNQQIAQVIAQQLGGSVRKIALMVGARDFVAIENGLQFSFRSCRKANKVRITLNSMDTYDVEFFKYNRRTFECPMVHEVSGAYCDMLTDVFESFTGLYLSLR